MGCSTSSRATVKEPSSKNLHRSRAVKKQAENDPLTGTVNTVSQGGSVAGDYSSEGRLPDSSTAKLPPAKEQNTDIRDGLSKKPVSLTERERQSSSDILEELRMQGIIKTSSANSNNRAADDAMLIDTGNPPQKPPAKLEKLEIKRKHII